MTRMMMAGLGLTILTACEAPAPKPQWPLRCDESFQSLVGTNIGAVTLPRALPHRIISPGMAVTEDYNPDRLNVFVDDKGWIAKVECW